MTPVSDTINSKNLLRYFDEIGLQIVIFDTPEQKGIELSIDKLVKNEITIESLYYKSMIYFTDSSATSIITINEFIDKNLNATSYNLTLQLDKEMINDSKAPSIFPYILIKQSSENLSQSKNSIVILNPFILTFSFTNYLANIIKILDKNTNSAT